MFGAAVHARKGGGLFLNSWRRNCCVVFFLFPSFPNVPQQKSSFPAPPPPLLSDYTKLHIQNAVDRANRAQEQAIRQRVSNFEAEVRDKIEAFATEPASVSHTFPHVEKSLRSIQ